MPAQVLQQAARRCPAGSASRHHRDDASVFLPAAAPSLVRQRPRLPLGRGRGLGGGGRLPARRRCVRPASSSSQHDPQPPAAEAMVASRTLNRSARRLKRNSSRSRLVSTHSRSIVSRRSSGVGGAERPLVQAGREAACHDAVWPEPKAQLVERQPAELAERPHPESGHLLRASGGSGSSRTGQRRQKRRVAPGGTSGRGISGAAWMVWLSAENCASSAAYRPSAMPTRAWCRSAPAPHARSSCPSRSSEPYSATSPVPSRKMA